jgi:hypothetical protein
LLKFVAEAFVNDPECLHWIGECQHDSTLLQVYDVFEQLCKYCLDRQLRLYAFFDQHNGISETSRNQFPFCLPHGVFPVARFWRMASAQVVISASANNSFYLQVAVKDKWPVLYITEPFTKEEAVQFLFDHEFFLPTDPTTIEVNPTKRIIQPVKFNNRVL